MAWDPKIYLAFAAQRTRSAAELLARIAEDSPKHVADLGCGPGNSTELLAARWPEAEIDGIESSAEMLEEARASGIRAKWIQADVATWQPQRKYDVLYSNAALQWMEGHEHLVPRLMGFVAEAHTFAFQVPRNFDAPSHTLMRTVAEEGPWAAKLRNIRKPNVLSPEAYFDMLSPLAKTLDIWETIYLQVMEGDDPVFRWVSGTGLRPFVQALDGSERGNYEAEYRRRLREAYPKREDGKTLFPFRRLFVIAKR